MTFLRKLAEGFALGLGFGLAMLLPMVASPLLFRLGLTGGESASGERGVTTRTVSSVRLPRRRRCSRFPTTTAWRSPPAAGSCGFGR